MRILCLKAAAFVFLGTVRLFAGTETNSPKIDKARIEQYVRYAEGFTPNVKLQADDPTPSAYPGLNRIVVHVSLGDRRQDRAYYLMPDGQRLISGNVWDLSSSPFLDTQQHLPHGPSFGPAAAKVTIVTFSDLQCPYCRQLARTLRDNVPKKYPSDVRVVFADFPLDSIHKWARAASEAAHCLSDGNSDAFWAFHDWMFEHQGEINEANLREKVLGYAKERNMDVGSIGTCMQSRGTAKEVEQSERAGELLQVQQTPTVFVNGRMLSGAVSWETLEAVIKLELNRPKDISSGVTP